MIKTPSRPILLVGDSVILHLVNTIADWFGISVKACHETMRFLRVPPIAVGRYTYYSAHAIERALFGLSRLGGPGFAFPGSTLKKRGTPRGVAAIDDDLLAKMLTPELDGEMQRISTLSRNTIYKAVRNLANVLGTGFLNDVSRRTKKPHRAVDEQVIKAMKKPPLEE